jgi:hypothetical protein
MYEHDKARPVSGEIMAGGGVTPERRARDDASDAEFETMDEGPRQPAARSAAPANAGMEMLRETSGSPATQATRQGGPLFWTAGLFLVVLAFWVSGGHSLVRQAVLQVPAVQDQPLRIADVASRVEAHEGGDVLFVDGKARNEGRVALPVPPIAIIVTASDGTSTRYFLGTRGTEVAPGESYAFSSRLEAPRNGVKTVSVTFQESER